MCSFFDVISLLMTISRDTHKGGTLVKLNPVLVDGTLRVGGHLCHAPLAFSRKHPIILPSDHHVTRLIIEDQHRKSGYCGMRQTLAACGKHLRHAANTWTHLRHAANVLDCEGAATVRKILGKCVFCRLRNAQLSSQVMSDLPAERLTPNKPPCYCTGVDFFAPFTVLQARSYVKRYGCILTCFVSRTVHLEVAHALTVDSFTNAFTEKNFFSTWYCCTTSISLVVSGNLVV